MKKGKKLFSLLLALCLTIAMAVPVFADDAEIVNKMRSGVLQVNLNWIDQNGGRHFIQGGSGFLINDQTLLTNQHVVTMTQETKEAASALYGVDFVNDNKLDVRVQVVVQRDVVIDASVIQSSAEMDVAILELSSPIYDRISLELGDSANVKETQAIYVLGFPLLSELAQDVRYYTSDDVSVTSGIVSKKMERNSTPFIQHGAKISDGNSGGPLVAVDSDGVGRVIGINTSRVSIEEGYYYAMEINDVKTLLNQLGVTYNEGSGTTGETTGTESNATTGTEGTGTNGGEVKDDPVVEPVAADTSKLESAISDAEDKLADGKYTEDSVKELEDKLDSAYEVMDDDEASQEIIDKAQDEVEKAADDLEEQKGPGMMLWIIIGAAVVIIVVIVVILVVSSGNKKKKEEMERERMMRQRAEEQRRTAPAPRAEARSYNPVQEPSAGAGETSVLGEGRGETTVLGASAQSAAYMIRKKTNERVVISAPSFTIGKERSRVNYCISDNTSVSRCHARISRKGSQYFVADMNSTNFTFVNGVKVVPGQEVALKDNDTVRFADEDFEFHM
ncbi:MAG: trypsin-like peptidase domain-containing protein [Blautia sp.]|nr:trypsin-like peptidase domain-containing protein [Blautia sp.]